MMAIVTSSSYRPTSSECTPYFDFHATFPLGVDLDRSASSANLAKCKATLLDSSSDLDVLVLFRHDLTFPVASDRSTRVKLINKNLQRDNEHIMVLVLGWAYVL